MMSETNSKIVLAVGVTALLTAVLLITAFLGYLYLRQPAEPVQASNPGSVPSLSPARRPKAANPVPAADILKVAFLESVMTNRPAAPGPGGYLSNVNTTNYSSSSSIVTFASDGTASKETTSEGTINGVKQAPKNERFTAAVDAASFSELANVFADNDFANEPDSRDITSLPIKKVLTITYEGGEKVINTGHMDKNSPETAAMLAAFKNLEKKAAWQPVR